MKNLSCILCLALAALFLTGTLHAQVPRLINYQGRVAVDGVNFDSAMAGVPGKFRFSLVNADGATLYWLNSDDADSDGQPDTAVELPVTKGLYSVLLGDESLPNMLPIPASAFAAPDLRLRVWFDDGVNASQLLTPDQRLAPAAYLADGAVTAATIADEAIIAAKIAPGTIDGTRLAPASLDFSLLQVPNAPGAGQVLGFNGASLNWIAPGVGDGIWTDLGGNAYRSTGNVGIGTATPSVKFVVADGGGQLGFSGVYIRAGILGGGNGGELDLQGGWSDNDGGRIRLGGSERGDADRNVVQFFQNNLERMRINNGGKVGIGTTTPANPLTLRTNTGSHGFEHTDGAVRLGTYVGGSTGGGWLGTISPHRLNFFVNNGEPSFSIAANGFDATLSTADFYFGHALRRGSPGRALVDLGDRLVVNFGDWGYTVIGGSVTEVRTLRITGGADLAEPFQMKEEELEKGSVVVIDDEHPGRLKRSTGAYDTRVAGIISGANGVNPGIALHQEGLVEGGQNVALSGRVYVQADASSGAIKPGDLLTTSDTPGHAMKVTEHTRSQGAVIGKAMSSLNEGTGMVLVLVSLQ